MLRFTPMHPASRCNLLGCLCLLQHQCSCHSQRHQGMKRGAFRSIRAIGISSGPSQSPYIRSGSSPCALQRLREGRAEAVEALAGSLITQMAAGTQHSRKVAGGTTTQSCAMTIDSVAVCKPCTMSIVLWASGPVCLKSDRIPSRTTVPGMCKTYTEPQSLLYHLVSDQDERLPMHTGGLLQTLMRDFPGLRWSLSVLTVLYLGASGNMGRDADMDTSDGAQTYLALQQVALKFSSLCLSCPATLDIRGQGCVLL